MQNFVISNTWWCHQPSWVWIETTSAQDTKYLTRRALLWNRLRYLIPLIDYDHNWLKRAVNRSCRLCTHKIIIPIYVNAIQYASMKHPVQIVWCIEYTWDYPQLSQILSWSSCRNKKIAEKKDKFRRSDVNVAQPLLTGPKIIPSQSSLLHHIHL